MVAHRVFQALDAAAFGEEEGEIVAVGHWQAQTRSGAIAVDVAQHT
jgi:hypothetical protein